GGISERNSATAADAAVLPASRPRDAGRHRPRTCRRPRSRRRGCGPRGRGGFPSRGLQFASRAVGLPLDHPPLLVVDQQETIERPTGGVTAGARLHAFAPLLIVGLLGGID